MSGEPLLPSETAATPATPPEDILVAEPLPDLPGPLSFGIRTLLGLTAIVGLQFALISYLGPLAGLLLGIGLCALAIVGLIVAAAVGQWSPDERRLQHLDRAAIRLAIGIVVLLMASVIAGGGQIIYSSLESVRLAWRVQRHLGFTYRERFLWNGSTTQRVLDVTAVTSGGAFDQAGIAPGDVLVLPGTPRELLVTLDDQRGKPVDLTIASGVGSGPGATLQTATERAVTVAVPP